MNNISLPIGQPEISTYNWHANLLSVLSKDERTKPWVFSNYIQIHCLDNSSLDTYFDYYNNPHLLPERACPWLHVQNVRKELLSALNVNLNDFLIESLKQDNYVFTFADLFYIPASEHYQKKHWIHEIFISGYNSEQRTFLISDYFRSKYSSHMVTQENVYQALAAVEESGWSIPFNGVELWSFLEHAVFAFDPGRVVKEIEDYLSGYNSTENFRGYYNPLKPYYFGINVYKKLTFYMNNLLEDSYHFLDIRPFHLLWEHKACMLNRIRWMGENGYLSEYEDIVEEYSAVEQTHHVIRNMALKYFKTCNRSDLQKAMVCIEGVVERETQILTRLLSRIIQG